MRAGVLNLLALQGSTFSRTLTWQIDGQPVNLTGYQARMQIRTVPANIKPARLLLNLTTTSNRGLVLDHENGGVTISISAADTSTLPAGSHVYDLELVSGDYVQRLVQGKFDVSAEVTK
jgi:hypothetical protein